MLPPNSAKAELRRQVRERLRSVTREELATWSDLLIGRLQTQTELWATPGTVALFGGLRNEPDLITQFLPWLRSQGWRTLLFAVEGVSLSPYEVTGTEELKRGPLGVWEPVTEGRNAVSLADLTLILVPGLAFSNRDGTRLGRGGGYYDRLLSAPSVTAKRLGIAFESQVFPEIPHESHDARVETLLTEKKTRHW
jgi:5-formyltetrahydrofolate cyclo-ligase